MINRVVLVGRLTKDVELRKTQSNISYVRFTLACDRPMSQNGQASADFINCVAWRQSADFLANYGSKGRVVGVDGRITTGSYDGQNGKVYTTEVTCDQVRLLDNNRDRQTQSQNMSNQTFTPRETFQQNAFDDDFSNTPALDISSDDLPFY